MESHPWERGPVSVVIKSDKPIIECWMGIYFDDLPLWIEPDFLFFNLTYGLSTEEISKIHHQLSTEETLNLFYIPLWVKSATKQNVNISWLLRLEVFTESSKVSFDITDLSDHIIEKQGVTLSIITDDFAV